jgi:hypothetical protein
MLNYSSSGSKMSLKHNSSTDDDSDYNDQDPGREVIEKNIRNRLQRIADYTKDELNKVLKRVDKVCIIKYILRNNILNLLDIR